MLGRRRCRACSALHAVAQNCAASNRSRCRADSSSRRSAWDGGTREGGPWRMRCTARETTRAANSETARRLTGQTRFASRCNDWRCDIRIATSANRQEIAPSCPFLPSPFPSRRLSADLPCDRLARASGSDAEVPWRNRGYRTRNVQIYPSGDVPMTGTAYQ